ncbi:MAG TPA: integrase core domain-containing protein [Rugosimonospora sp.]|nr:integrase core domain-containing protein [Rugosimonospora sp.]
MLAIIDQAVDAGWKLGRICDVLQIDRRRVWRWQHRQAAGTSLDDRPPGGGAIHGLLDWEITEILALAEEWGPLDRSHRKLAHRGSYLGRVWVSPSTVLRVLAAHDVNLPKPAPRPVRGERRPWPEWVEYRANQVWGFDVTHFSRCRRAPNCFAIIDLVSRKWIRTLLSAEETAIQTKVVFLEALEAEGLIDTVEDRLMTGELPDPDRLPILLAVSDNGPPMTADATRAFMALCSIAQHFGRPGVPTDQAPIESFFGHIKAEWPHLEEIRDPEILVAELERVRIEYNTIRLHAAIGYVTPEDEHEGRGDKIRQARQEGLRRADQARRAARTNHRPEHPHHAV